MVVERSNKIYGHCLASWPLFFGYLIKKWEGEQNQQASQTNKHLNQTKRIDWPEPLVGKTNIKTKERQAAKIEKRGVRRLVIGDVLVCVCVYARGMKGLFWRNEREASISIQSHCDCDGAIAPLSVSSSLPKSPSISSFPSLWETSNWMEWWWRGSFLISLLSPFSCFHQSWTEIWLTSHSFFVTSLPVVVCFFLCCRLQATICFVFFFPLASSHLD